MTREEAIVDIRDNIKPVVGGKSLDMAIKALEQEPITDRIEYGTDGNAYRLTISNGKELEQEPILDKIKTEIERLTITEGGEDYTRKMAELYSLKIKVLQIIDKYRGEQCQR